MVNYYELLGVNQNADRLVIEQAIKKTRRLWNNRANSPDSAIRAEAEKHVREVAEAEKILLDTEKREAYNRELAQNAGRSNEDKQSSNDSPNWEAEYWRAYNRDLNQVAAEIAYKAVRANERDGRAWYLYGEALRRGGDAKKAVPALERASMMISDANVYRQLGFALDDLGDIAAAIKAFRKATECDPDDCEFYYLRAARYRELEMINAALSEAREAYRMAPNDNFVRFELFFALYEDALQSMSYNRSSGKHLITNKVQLDYVNGLLEQMSTTIPKDENEAKCKKYMEEIVQYVVDAESKKGGFLSRTLGYQYNYNISNADTRASGKH